MDGLLAPEIRDVLVDSVLPTGKGPRRGGFISIKGGNSLHRLQRRTSMESPRTSRASNVGFRLDNVAVAVEVEDGRKKELYGFDSLELALYWRRGIRASCNR